MSRVDVKIDRLLNFIYKSDIEKLNDHLPTEFKSLKDISSNNLHTIKSRNGLDIIIDRSEINLLCNLLPLDLHDKLMLPIIFLRRMDLGKGVYELLGGKVEAFTILKLLGRDISLENITLPIRIYRPQLFKLKTILPTSIIVAFSTPIEEE